MRVIEGGAWVRKVWGRGDLRGLRGRVAREAEWRIEGAGGW